MKHVPVLALAWVVASLPACGADDNHGVGDGSTWDALDLAGDDVAADTAPDPDAATDPDLTDPGSDVVPTTCGEKSYIWIANSDEGTLSKLCTLTGEELARYYTCPVTSSCDPSRTSVNLHGDMVVTNRDPTSGPSSVTKFAAEKVDCIDHDGDGIETSTGPDDVRPWGEDECMIWNTPLPDAGSAAMGCRATAWDGTEDEDTGYGGRVWIGCMMNHVVYVLNGDTGIVETQAPVGIGPYGGAMDGRGSFWTVAMTCTVMMCRLSRLNMTSLTEQIYNVPCGYGISVDREGYVWTAGMGCVNKLDPMSGANTTYSTGMTSFNRGIAVDGMGSVWAAVTTGEVLRVNESDVTLINRFPVHTGGSHGDIVGVAIDFQGYVWAVAYNDSATGYAIKIDPATYETESFPIGRGPYTYSDMTGYQLSIVEIPI